MMVNSMIDLFVSWLMPLTILLSMMLLMHQVVLNKLGPAKAYLLWLIVPLGLCFYSLPFSWFSGFQAADAQIQQYIIQPTKSLQQQFTVEWLVGCWVLISSFMLAYWLLSHVQFLRQTKLSTADRQQLAIKLPKKLTVYQSAQVFSPMLVGVYKQKLLLPEDFSSLYDTEQQRLILEHEICHFDRNDIYWNLLAYVLLAMFWFHPLAWLAYFRFRRDQELSCDDIVLARKQLNSRISYSRALLVAAESAPPLAFAQLSFKKYGDKEIMFERIKHIKSTTRASKVSLTVASLLSVSLLSGLSYAGNVGFAGDSSDKAGYDKKVKHELMPIIRIEPEYPMQAAKDGIEGSVVLKFDVNLSGKVENVSVIKAIPEATFDKVSKVALKQWEYDAKGKAHKDLLVQLDYRLSPDSTTERVDLIEKIKVTQ